MLDFILFGHGSRKTEITEFDSTGGVNKEVSWLQVPMNNVGCMQKIKSTQRIIDNRQDMVLTKFYLRLGIKQLFHVALMELYNHEEVRELASVHDSIVHIARTFVTFRAT